MSKQQTLEQKRAQHAWTCAQEGINKHGNDYVNDAKGLPALIMNSGLMQVMAYCHDKGGRHETLASHLRGWLHQQCKTPAEFAPFMEHMIEDVESHEFQNITSEAFAWLKWLRQMAAALKGG